MKFEHKLVNIRSVAGGARPDRVSEFERIEKACNKLAEEGWEIVTQLWTSEHLLLRRRTDEPQSLDSKTLEEKVAALLAEMPWGPNKDTVTDLLIPMTMQEANALNAAMGLVEHSELDLDPEDREPLRWVMNRIGKAWTAEAERRAAKNDNS
jgi:hypothetical protein